MQLWKISESYTDPFLIYEKAKKAGMTFVTLTDHNSIDGCLLLKERYGDSVITGVESTTYFPEDGCKVHLLVYGINEQHFKEIQKLRKDIYELREYIREQKLAHSIAHATYSVQGGRLTVNHLEKLIVLFNFFEAINGSRNRSDNLQWMHILKNLTPACLSDLCAKHSLEPFDGEPWIKGLTAGTDDHGGIFIGRTYTELDAWDSDHLLAALKEKRSFPGGSHSDYQSLAFSVYKVLYDCSKQKQNYRANSLLSQLTETLFESKPMGMLNKIRIKRLGMRAMKQESEICRSFYELALTIQKQAFPSIGEAIQFVDSKLAHIADEFLKVFSSSLEENLNNIDLPKLVQNVAASLPGIFLSLPFMFALRHLNENRILVDELTSDLQLSNTSERSRILWFTDTINDLNGVSYTLHEIGRLAHRKGLNLKIVASLDDVGPGETVPPYILNLPFIHSFRLPFYERYSLKVPSVLRSLKEIYRYDPDTIYISTPGPVGLVGLLGAKLMNVKSVGFYHTDFTLQTSKIVDDLSVANMLEAYTKWFYGATDEIRVPTKEYIKMLERRGFESRKLHLFKRGIDTRIFLPRFAGRAFLKERWGLNGDKTLLYVGRISKDKSLDFLLETFSKLSEARPSAKLLIVGDGPHLQELQKRANGTKSILFAGRIEHEELSLIYSGADLFLFPSTTDTFGKAVLEAQACGCPAVVSDEGGPKELIVDGKTGFVAEAGNLSDWTRKIERALSMMDHSPIAYQKMKEEARTHAVKNHSWDEALDGLLTQAVLPDPLWEKMIA